ncbi:MAG: WD40 repeat-like protein [Pleopsidium flavum]|nr:MAG: WD40 repeat-like protein [Pleopsidium flavum]
MSITAHGIWAASPSTTRGQPTQLSADPKGERIAYASNKSIFLRSIDNSAISTQYTAHTAQTTVARFSPSGYYVASGDVSGSVRVWDCVGEGSTKGDYHIIGGRINDLAWDGDSQRIIAVGNGKERFGHCITADSGNSVGEISGHSSQINSVSIRQQRPLRAATGSDDTSIVFYHGAPFKFNTSLRGQHNNFVYGVAFSPDGANLVSVGADRKVCLYDGKSGEVKGQIGEGEHKGSIFSVSWARDSKRFVTSSADQTVKIWDVEAGKVVQSWKMGEGASISIPDHQVGVVWPAGRSDGLILSLNLVGDLSYLVEGSQKPVKLVQGHQKNITSLAANGHVGHGETLWTGGIDGRISSWNAVNGVGENVDGESHTNYVSGMTAASEGQGRMYSAGWDDTLRVIDTSANTFTGGAIKLAGQPKGIATSGKTALVITNNELEMLQDGQKMGEKQLNFEPTALAASKTLIVVGGNDNIVHVYSPSLRTLEPVAELRESTSQISSLALSHDGSHLAVGAASGKIKVYKTDDWSTATDRWSSHTGRIASIAWSPEGTHAVSGGLDTNVFVWSLANPGLRIKATNAHKDGVNGVAWIDGGNKVVSVGADAAVKVWAVEGLN